MRCPECQDDDTRVVDSRTAGDSIRRRRECTACGARFTTHERVEKPVLWVIKRSGRKEPFSMEKVLHGISLACRKRPVDANAMEDAAQGVLSRLEALREAEIKSSQVGEAVMEVLKQVDSVAYVRFASVYRNFESVDQFVDAIRPLRERP